MGASLVSAWKNSKHGDTRHNPPSFFFFYSTQLSHSLTLTLIRCAVCPSFPAQQRVHSLLFSYPAAKCSIQFVPWPDPFPRRFHVPFLPLNINIGWSPLCTRSVNKGMHVHNIATLSCLHFYTRHEYMRISALGSSFRGVGTLRHHDDRHMLNSLREVLASSC